MAVCPLCSGDFVSERILPVFSPKRKPEGDGRDPRFSSRLIFLTQPRKQIPKK